MNLKPTLAPARSGTATLKTSDTPANDQKDERDEHHEDVEDDAEDEVIGAGTGE